MSPLSSSRDLLTNEIPRRYALTSGDSFVSQAAHATYDIAGRGDTEGTPADALLQRASALRWDRRTKKFIRGDGVGADNKRLVRSESGQKLPASFKSGVFDDWRRKQHISVPKVGEAELKGKTVSGVGEKKYRHKAGIPKTDKEKREGRTVGKPGKAGSAPGGLKTADQIRKERFVSFHLPSLQAHTHDIVMCAGTKRPSESSVRLSQGRGRSREEEPSRGSNPPVSFFRSFCDLVAIVLHLQSIVREQGSRGGDEERARRVSARRG